MVWDVAVVDGGVDVDDVGIADVDVVDAVTVPVAGDVDVAHDADAGGVDGGGTVDVESAGGCVVGVDVADCVTVVVIEGADVCVDGYGDGDVVVVVDGAGATVYVYIDGAVTGDVGGDDGGVDVGADIDVADDGGIDVAVDGNVAVAVDVDGGVAANVVVDDVIAYLAGVADNDVAGNGGGVVVDVDDVGSVVEDGVDVG